MCLDRTLRGEKRNSVRKCASALNYSRSLERTVRTTYVRFVFIHLISRRSIHLLFVEKQEKRGGGIHFEQELQGDYTHKVPPHWKRIWEDPPLVQIHTGLEFCEEG
ncbi:hypothetical protein ACJX0J_032614 [Zea mays]